MANSVTAHRAKSRWSIVNQIKPRRPERTKLGSLQETQAGSNRHHYIGVALRRSAEAEVAAKLDGLFDDHSTTPPSPSLISPDSPHTEVTR